MKSVILFIGSALLLNAILLLAVSNFNLGFILQGCFSLALIIYALNIKKINKNVHIVIGVICLISLVFAVFLGIYGNLDNTQYDENAVIVLGAGIHGEQVGLILARRLDKAVEYHSRNPNAVIVVCGGQGPQEDITEALAMERYLISKGIPAEKILKEEESTSTFENLYFAREILKQVFPDGFKSVLITNDFHVYRAERIAKYAGITVNHIAAPTEWYTLPVNYLREMLAIAKMLILPPKTP